MRNKTSNDRFAMNDYPHSLSSFQLIDFPLDYGISFTSLHMKWDARLAISHFPSWRTNSSL